MVKYTDSDQTSALDTTSFTSIVSTFFFLFMLTSTTVVVTKNIWNSHPEMDLKIKSFRVSSSVLTISTKLSLSGNFFFIGGCKWRILVRPVVMYGCETWTLTGSLGNTLNVLERKILRKVCDGPIQENNVWKIWNYEELSDLFGSEIIV